jgi:hypothetical protein
MARPSPARPLRRARTPVTRARAPLTAPTARGRRPHRHRCLSLPTFEHILPDVATPTRGCARRSMRCSRSASTARPCCETPPCSHVLPVCGSGPGDDVKLRGHGARRHPRREAPQVDAANLQVDCCSATASTRRPASVVAPTGSSPLPWPEFFPTTH